MEVVVVVVVMPITVMAVPISWGDMEVTEGMGFFLMQEILREKTKKRSAYSLHLSFHVLSDVFS